MYVSVLSIMLLCFIYYGLFIMVLDFFADFICFVLLVTYFHSLYNSDFICSVLLSFPFLFFPLSDMTDSIILLCRFRHNFM